MSQPKKKRKDAKNSTNEEILENDILKIPNNEIEIVNIDTFVKSEDNLTKNDLFQKIINGKDELIKAKDIIINELQEKILLLKEKINYITKIPNTIYENSTSSNKNINNVSYSDCLRKSDETINIKKKSEVIVNNNFIIIKPNCIQENKLTRKDLGKFINPAKLKVNIIKIDDLKGGTVKIQCKSKEELEKIENEVKNKLGSNYVISPHENRIPRIKIIGIEDEINEADLINSILEKNEFLKDAKLKVVKIKKMKTKFMAILEIDCISFKKAMDKGVIFVDFSVCTVFEHLDILRCYKCTGYYHSAQNCTKSQICMKCGNSDHNATSCTTDKANLKCSNCSDANSKFDAGYFINHSPFDRNCEVFRRHVKIVQSKTQYDKEI